MPKVNIMNCNSESVTKVYPFALFISNKITIAGNIGVYEDLII